MIEFSFSRFLLVFSDPHGHIPCLERQEKGVSFEESISHLICKEDFKKRDVGL